MKTLLTICLVLLMVSGTEAEAALVFRDGGVHIVEYVRPFTGIQVFDTDYGRATTVTWVGSDVLEGFSVYGSSIGNISGGYIHWGGYRERSSGNVSGGELVNLWTHHESQVSISDDALVGQLRTYDYAQVYIIGGTVINTIKAFGNSRIDIYGGQFPIVVPWNNAEADSRTINLYDTATIVIHGSDFMVSFPAFGPYVIPYGTYTGIGSGPTHLNSIVPYFTLTGTLANGDLLNSNFTLNDYASLVLIPEPATVLLLGLGMVLLRKERK